MLHQTLYHVQWQWENDGGVLLGSNGVEGLQVAKLQGARRLCDYQRGLFQSAGCIHLALGCDHLLRRETNVNPNISNATVVVGITGAAPWLWPHGLPPPQQPWPSEAAKAT